MDKEKIRELKKIANEIRKESLIITHNAQSGHPGGSLSEADILSALYFYKLRINSKKPRWEDRDRFVLSKGHACPAYYAALAMKGFFDKKELEKFRKINSMLQGHPELKIPGVDFASGSLGQGVPVSNGMALAGKLDKGEIEYKNPQDLVVTYHDPCHLGRHMKVYEEPRNLLKSIPGIKLVEMDAIRENAFCCGAGGGVKITFPDVALGSAEYRVTQAKETGAEQIVSICPFCKTNIQDAIDNSKDTIKFTDLMELIDKTL